MTPTGDDELETRLAEALSAARTDSRLHVTSWANGPTRIARAARKRRLRRTSIAVASLAVMSLVLVGGADWWLNHTLNSVQLTNSQVVPGAPAVNGKGHLAAKPPAGQPFTVLILGTDSRTGTGTEYGTNVDACQCSDTIILARVNPQTSKVSLLSVPRDSRVDVTGYNRTEKINAAFGKGPDNSVATIEQNLGIEVTHWVVLDLAGFKSIVNAVGGIKLDFPYPIKDKNAGLDVETTGCQKVTGDEALAISRARELKYFKNGDWTYDPTWEYGRQRREQILMRVIAAHTVKASMSNPLTARSVIDTFTSGHRLAIDNQVSVHELLDLAESFAGFDASTMQTFSLPTYTKTIDGSDYEILRPAADAATIKAWYGAVLPAPKPTASPTTQASATPSTATPSKAGSVTANQPWPFDPRPCT